MNKRRGILLEVNRQPEGTWGPCHFSSLSPMAVPNTSPWNKMVYEAQSENFCFISSYNYEIAGF